MTTEYDANATARERPEGLETKSTVDTLIGYNPAPVPHASRSGASVSDDEREDSTVFPGTFAAGTGVKNEEVSAKAARGGGRRGAGIATDSGGTQRSGRSGSRSSTKTASTGAGKGAETSAPSGTETSTPGDAGKGDQAKS